MISKETGDNSLINIDKADASVNVLCSVLPGSRPPGNARRSLKHLPGNRLSRHIAYYWRAVGDKRETPRISIYPNGGVGLIFNFGEALLRGDTTVEKGLFFEGTSVKAVHLHPTGNIDMLGIRFRPGGFNRFFAVDLGKLHNVFGTLDRIIGHIFPARCQEVIALCMTNGEKIAAIETWLTCRYSEPNGNLSPMQLIVDAMLSDRYNFDSQSFIQDTNAATRRLQRLFKKEIGMSPKQLARILRAGSARQFLVNNSDLSFSDITYKCGYYDQSHFNRDFKYVFGTTPSAYRKNWRCTDGGPTILILE